MAYGSINYISKILWRFFGGAEPDNPEKGLQDIQFIFNDGKVLLKPYTGEDGTKNRYTRQVQFHEDDVGDSMVIEGQGDPTPAKDLVYASEPKAVCFCDIPITHLAAHMKKYNSVGIGIDRDRLAKKAKDLQPVRYYFIRDKEEFDQDIQGIFKIRNEADITTVDLEKYVKIPTFFKGSTSGSGIHKHEEHDPSEGFNSIYEEREWRHFDAVTLEYSEISFLLLPSRKYLSSIRDLQKLFDAKVGIIYADELFPDGNQ